MQVTFEDQQKINSFGRLNTYLQELEIEIKNLKDEIQRFEWSTEEIWTSDNIFYNIGEMFIVMEDADQTESNINAALETKKQILENKEKLLTKISTKMNELKSELYAKFGKNNINLDP